MTPETMIADLDAALARRGTDVWLVRGENQVKIRARADTFNLNETPLTPGVTNIPKKVVMSMTQIRAAQQAGTWPSPPQGADPNDIYLVDPGIPQKNDYLVSNGESKAVSSINAITINNVVVRVELMVEG